MMRRSRPILLVVTILGPFLASACQSAMSVEEARKDTGSFEGRSFVPPPRTITDITVERKTQLIDDIQIETLKIQAPGPRGTYLITLNNQRSHVEGNPPHRALVLAIDTDGSMKIYRRFRSSEELINAIDFKPQPDGLYTFGLIIARPPLWRYGVRILDPRDGTEIIEPKGYPVDPALDGHETVIHFKDRRLFLFYRERKEEGRHYLDMEVKAISAKTGEQVGFWTSKGLFPSDRTGNYLHFNSLFPISDDQVLASSRVTDALYIINLSTGRIDDKIDSTSWKIIDDPMNGFSRQHFAHFLKNGNLLMFDNRDGSESNPRSRAVEYKVNWKERTLTMVWERRVEESMPFRFGWGSASAVGEDEVLIGWGDYPRKKGYCDGREGSFPVFTHMRRDGTPLFELRAPCGWATYRVYFLPR